MSKALVEILGTAVSYLRSLRESADATEGFEIDLKKLAITATESARAQVKASVARDARLRSEITAYRDLGAAATRGSREQIAADNLAANAQQRLSRSLSVTAGESRRLSAASQRGASNVRAFNREGERGAGIFHHLGRSLFYASSYLLGGYGLLYGLKSTLTASEDQRAEMGQLATAVRDAGLSYRGTRGELDAILKSQAKLGFTSLDSITNLNLEVRATRSVKTAREALSLADNISRGRHVALSIAANAVAKAYGGQTASLRRLLPFIGKGESAYQAIRDAQAAYSGAAVRFANSEAGAQQKLSVALQGTETIIGNELSPTVQKLSTRLANWLNQSKNQARIQKDVKNAVHDLGRAAHLLFAILKAGESVVRDVDGATGSFKNTVILLGGALAALKLAKAVDGLAGMASKALYASSGMDAAAGSAATLDTALAPMVGTLLAAAGAAVGLGLALDKISSWIPGKPLQKLGKGIADLINGTPGGTVVTPAQARAEGAALLAKNGGVAAWNKAHPHAADPKAGGTAPGSSLASSAAQANALALAGARTDAQKLAAYVEQRKIIAGEIAQTRAQLKGASGSERDLLINQLIDLSKQDTAAFKKITALQKHAAHAAYTGAQTAALGLQASADAAKSTGAIRKSYQALVDFYKREASDTHLTALERARYAKLAIDEQNKMGKAIVREQKAAARAVEAAQLASLGVTKGSSISELLQRVKDAATAKEQGQKYSIGLGPPGIKALKSEADQVSKALKGTYLDTDVSRGLITKIRGLLNGQLGALNSDMRNKIQQLLQGLKNDMKSFDGFDLSLADQHRRFLDRRFADLYGTGVANGSAPKSRLPRFKGIPHGIAATAAIQPSTINYHFSPNMQVIANEPIGHALDRAFFKQRIALGGVG